MDFLGFINWGNVAAIAAAVGAAIQALKDKLPEWLVGMRLSALLCLCLGLIIPLLYGQIPLAVQPILKAFCESALAFFMVETGYQLLSSKKSGTFSLPSRSETK